MSAGRILVVDDEPQIRRILRTTLTGAGYEVDDSRTGEEALEKVREYRPDLVILDINMPGIGRPGSVPGAAVGHADRHHHADGAQLGRGQSESAGRRRRRFRHQAVQHAGTAGAHTRGAAAAAAFPRNRRRRGWSSGSLVIDFTARTVDNSGVTSHLTPKELDLLRYLTQHPNEAVSHRQLLQAVWGPDYGDQVDYLRVFIRSLRKKIETNPEHPEYITTEPWVGYRFNVPTAP